MKRRLCSVVLAAILVSCSTPGPVDAMKGYIRALYKGDVITITTYMCENDREIVDLAVLADPVRFADFSPVSLSFRGYTASDIYKGLNISLSNEKYEEVSRYDNIVNLSYDLTVVWKVDVDKLRAVGLPDADIAALVQEFQDESQDLTGEVPVITEDGKWVVCAHP